MQPWQNAALYSFPFTAHVFKFEFVYLSTTVGQMLCLRKGDNLGKESSSGNLLSNLSQTTDPGQK